MHVANRIKRIVSYPAYVFCAYATLTPPLMFSTRFPLFDKTTKFECTYEVYVAHEAAL